jgi:hypothetical protein
MNLASTMLAHAALAVGTGSAGSPGFNAPEDVLSPNSLKDLAKRGIRFARLEPQAY